jgi:hypothetical protein
MKLSELKPCLVCSGKITPIWYVIRVSQAMLNPHGANEVLGLTQMLGSLSLAEVISSQPDCVMVMGDEDPGLMTELAICQECFLMKDLNMAMLMESSCAQPEDGT